MLTREALLSKGWPQELVSSFLDKRERGLPKDSVLLLQGVSKSFAKKVLDNISLEVKGGEILGLVGPSGCGKTTLLKLLVGYYMPDQGDVVLKLGEESFSVSKDPNSVKSLVGFATQDASIYPGLSVFENLMYFVSLNGVVSSDRFQRCTELLKLVRLSNSKDVLAKDLSGGMQKRLDIACALSNNPKILLLDEPTADLDPVLRKEFWELVKDINKRNTTVIIASHFVSEIEYLCDRIAVISDAKLLFVGAPSALANVSCDVFFESLNKNYDAILAKLSVPHKVVRKGSELVLRSSDPAKLVVALANACQAAGDTVIRLEKGSALEALFS